MLTIVTFCILGPLIYYYPCQQNLSDLYLTLSVCLSWLDSRQQEQVENSRTLARIYEDPAPTSSYNKNLSVRSGIKQCPTTDFLQMLVRVPKTY